MTPQICLNIRIDSNTLDHNPINSYFQKKNKKKKQTIVLPIWNWLPPSDLPLKLTTWEDGFEEAKNRSEASCGRERDTVLIPSTKNSSIE